MLNFRLYFTYRLIGPIPISHPGRARKFREFSRPGRALIGLALVLSALAPGPARAETAYRFGVVPQMEPRQTFANWTPLLDELSSRTGIRFRLIVPRTMSDFEAGFRQEIYDFAFMNPYHFTVARKDQGYRPLVRDGSRQLYGIIVVRKDSPFRTLEDLRGTQMAFPSPNALGATLLNRSELTIQHGIDIIPVWSQTHSSAYLNVLLGLVEAAGGVMTTFRRQKTQVRNRLRILHETRRVPPHPIVAHPRVPSAHGDAVSRAIIAYATTAAGARVLQKIPMKNPVKTSFAEYEPLRRMGLDNVGKNN